MIRPVLPIMSLDLRGAVRLVLALCAIASAPMMARAETAGAPAAVHGEDSVLVVRAGDKSVTLDAAALDKLGRHSATFDTNWGVGGTWEGPLLSEVLAATGLGAADRIRMIAIDDYAIELDRATIVAGKPILAVRVDGKPLPLSNKGPFWLIWPDEAKQALDGTASLGNWIWSVVKIQDTAK